MGRPGLPGPTDLCVLLCRLYEDKGEADFMESLLQLFRSISDMMRGESDQTVRVKVGPRVQEDRPSSGGTTVSRRAPGWGESRCLSLLQSVNRSNGPGVASVVRVILLPGR